MTKNARKTDFLEGQNSKNKLYMMCIITLVIKVLIEINCTKNTGIIFYRSF